jgi:predicted nucleotidyltransferase
MNDEIKTPGDYDVILLVLAGSRAYGTQNPDSDRDIRGVCIPPLKFIVGLDRFEQMTTDPGGDQVIFDLRKFLRLAVDSNPNVLELLWTEGESILLCTEAGNRLRAIRENLLSKRVFQTFGGYARQQMYRLEHYKPEPGSRKAEDVEKYGYPVKHAMHLMRLLWMGTEVLRTGTLRVNRTGVDADVLLQIRRGEWTLERVMAEAAAAEVRLKAANEVTKLPARPDYDAANQLCIELMSERVVRETK